MPRHRPTSDVLDVYRRAVRKERYRRVTRRRPLVHLFHVPEGTLDRREIPLLSGRPYRAAVESGERLVWWFDPTDLVERTEGDLLGAFHAVVKRLRRDSPPRAEALECFRLKEREHLTCEEIARRFERQWPDCADPESRERRVKRSVRQVRVYLADNEKRRLAALTPRERAILKSLSPEPIEPVDD